MTVVPVIYRGLEGVYVKESQICFIDGEKSRLLYRGYSIEDLAGRATYEEVAALLLDGRLPTPARLREFSTHLAGFRKVPDPIARILDELGPSAHPVDGLRTALSALGALDPAEGVDRAVELERAFRTIAVMPSLVAHLRRVRDGQRPVPPRRDLGHAANFLCMLSGDPPDPEDARILDALLVLHAEHELNASTFACMVTASTRADLYAAVTSGIAALKGPLHGGANEDALRFILETGSPERAADKVRSALEGGGRIPGFGHRVYKNFDPRYRVLREMAESLARRKSNGGLFATAAEIENHALRRLSGSNIYPNVDFYSGLVMHLLGIPAAVFTPIFAVGRAAGWCAHILEQRERNRLLRPKAYYTGPSELVYRPPEERE
ncbi:MAG: citrate/2-methylcitrate synthase [Halobacteria archaeon]